MDVQGALRHALTGQRTQKVSVKAVLSAAKSAFGTWKEVARRSGVSERQLRRIRNEGAKAGGKSKGALDALGKTRDVRAAEVRPGRARATAKARNTGARVRVKAFQGPPAAAGGEYRRLRTVSFNIPGDVLGDIEDAYLDGDDARAEELLAEATQTYYGDGQLDGYGWDFGSVDELEIRPD